MNWATSHLAWPSPAAWFKATGADVACLDLAVQPLNEALVGQADLIAIYLPMHTATLLAAEVIPQLKSLNPRAHLCCYGLYAPTNESFLRHLGVDTILGGEFETGLIALYDRISSGNGQAHNHVQVRSIHFPGTAAVPGSRSQHTTGVGHDYATLQLPDGAVYQVGYTEASRGCKYLCRHCPIVPVYNGRFRIVQPDIVLADIRQQVAAGARHITFGDPDFLNGPGHAIPIVGRCMTTFPT